MDPKAFTLSWKIKALGFEAQSLRVGGRQATIINIKVVCNELTVHHIYVLFKLYNKSMAPYIELSRTV